MKKYLAVFVFTFTVHARAQYFEPIGMGIGIDGIQSIDTRVKSILGDTIHNKLLIGGEFLYADSIPVIDGCYWDGNSFYPMTGFVGSNFDMSSTMWNGYNVFAVDLGVHVFDSTQQIPFNFPQVFFGINYILDVISYNDTLYIGGGFYLQDGSSGLAKWNGTNWEGVGGSLTDGMGSVQCLGVYDGDLIAAGTFDSIGGIAANHIARWDGAQWHAMGGGVDVSAGGVQIRDICEYNGGLYAIGGFNVVDGVGSPGGFAKWNGSNWSIPSGYNGCNAYELQVYHNKLYICGIINNGIPPSGSLASYDGTSFQIFHEYYGDYNIFTMDTFQNYLYLGGSFQHVGNCVIANKIARFSDDSIICIPPVIETSGDTLFVNETGYFHWINCANGSIISGATSNTYVPDTAGNYAVIVTGGGCNDTTECVNYMGVNELQIADYKLQIYPNPANDELIINSKEIIDEIEITDVFGRSIIISIIKQSNFKLKIESLTNGIYFIKAKCINGAITVGRFVKQ